MKTIDEAAQDYSNKYWSNLQDYEKTSCFKAGVEFAQRWISVEEELPKNYNLVLVKGLNKNGGIEFATGLTYYDLFECKREWTVGDSDIVTVTHWRPIELK